MRRQSLSMSRLAGSLAAALLLSTACGHEPPRLIEGTSLRSAYQGLGFDCGTITLDLGDDGGFVLACAPTRDDGCGIPRGEAGGGTAVRIAGSWESRGGDLTLTFEEPVAGLETVLVFTECEVSVDARGETVLLPGLCWVESSEPTFADSSSLVSRADLMEFLHPTEGSGSSTSAL